VVLIWVKSWDQALRDEPHATPCVGNPTNSREEDICLPFPVSLCFNTSDFSSVLNDQLRLALRLLYGQRRFRRP
jgi:hypothetical protein